MFDNKFHNQLQKSSIVNYDEDWEILSQMETLIIDSPSKISPLYDSSIAIVTKINPEEANIIDDKKDILKTIDMYFDNTHIEDAISFLKEWNNSINLTITTDIKRDLSNQIDRFEKDDSYDYLLWAIENLLYEIDQLTNGEYKPFLFELYWKSNNLDSLAIMLNTAVHWVKTMFILDHIYIFDLLPQNEADEWYNGFNNKQKLQLRIVNIIYWIVKKINLIKNI